MSILHKFSLLVIAPRLSFCAQLREFDVVATERSDIAQMSSLSTSCVTSTFALYRIPAFLRRVSP